MSEHKLLHDCSGSGDVSMTESPTFTELLSVTSSKLVLSPLKEMSSPPPPRKRLFHCLSTSSNDSIDDGFLDFLAVDKEEHNTLGMPSGLSNLLSGTIVQTISPYKSGTSKKPNLAKHNLQRSLSISDTPTTTKVRTCRFRSPSVDDASVCAIQGFKCPYPPGSDSGDIFVPCKKQKMNDDIDSSTEKRTLGMVKSLSDLNQRTVLSQRSLLNYGFQRQTPAKPFQRSFSESEDTIKRALQRSVSAPDLIGDFSRNFALPLMEGKHADLKTISCETLAKLLNGHYDSEIATYQVIDCRYPYEYIGGHILNSINLYSKELVNDVLLSGHVPIPRDQQRRHVLVFHCEFSYERAPSMCRHLRQIDRDANKECYPRLHYPEIYLLHGGYKEFYESCLYLCEPSGYVPMLNQNNEADLRHFRAKSRSWAGDRTGGLARLPSKFSLKRLDE